jgi:hypothetical protein
MRIKNGAFVIPAATILIGTIGAVVLYWQPDYWRSVVGLESASNARIWHAIACGARLYLQKAQGGILELSWTELWGLTRPEFGFHCIEGRSLEAAIQTIFN